jgi:hypothetical protein
MDAILDDASHFPEHQLISLKYLFPNLLRPGGFYVVEDLFYNFYESFNPGLKHSFVSYAFLVMRRLAMAEPLPSAMQECVEVLCMYGLCSFKKGRSRAGAGSIRYHYSTSKAFCPQDLVPSTSLVQRQLSCESLFHRRVVYRIARSCPAETQWVQWAGSAEGGVFRKATVVPYVVGGSWSRSGSGNRSCSYYQAAPPRPFVVYDDNTHGLSAEVRVQAFEALFTDVLHAGGYYFWRNDPTFPASMNLFGRSLYQLYCEVYNVYQIPGREKMVPAFDPQVLPTNTASVCSNYSVENGILSVGCDAKWCFVQKSPEHVSRSLPPLRRKKKPHSSKRPVNDRSH